MWRESNPSIVTEAVLCYIKIMLSERWDACWILERKNVNLLLKKDTTCYEFLHWGWDLIVNK